jgi:hypothetical protein
MENQNWLWFGTIGGFFHIMGIIIPTDELIFFRGVAHPPTSLGYFSPSNLPHHILEQAILLHLPTSK